MARRARWIRLAPVEAHEFHAACAGLAGSQGRAGAPIVVWACARHALDGLVLEEEHGYQFALIVPARLAPGRVARWVAWTLSPAVAAYRDFGLRAYLNGDEICLHGRRIGGGQAETIGNCAVITSNLLASFDGGAPPASAGRVSEIRVWLRERLGLAMTQWDSESDAPTERALEAALRARIEAQHGWQFESSWPDEGERRAIEAARLPAYA